MKKINDKLHVDKPNSWKFFCCKDKEKIVIVTVEEKQTACKGMRISLASELLTTADTAIASDTEQKLWFQYEVKIKAF